MGGARPRLRQLDRPRRAACTARRPQGPRRNGRSTRCSSTPRSRRSSCPTCVKRIPTVVSLDATPRQYDELGDHYGHATSGARVERLKWRANRACFERAAHIVTWAAWTRQGLIDEYGVAASKITVVPPGVDVSRWKRVDARPDDADSGPIRILFVGGDLDRKGGLLLLDAFRTLRDDPSLPELELHLVTKTPVAAEKGLVVHSVDDPQQRRARRPLPPVRTSSACRRWVTACRWCCRRPVPRDCRWSRPTSGRSPRSSVTARRACWCRPTTSPRCARRSPRSPAIATCAAASATGRSRSLRESFDAERNAMRLAALLRDVAAAAHLVSAEPPMSAARRRVLLTVSGTIPTDLDDQIAARRPPPPRLPRDGRGVRRRSHRPRPGTRGGRPPRTDDRAARRPQRVARLVVLPAAPPLRGGVHRRRAGRHPVRRDDPARPDAAERGTS